MAEKLKKNQMNDLMTQQLEVPLLEAVSKSNSELKSIKDSELVKKCVLKTIFCAPNE